MEPAINPDLTHFLKAPYDLTFELFSDIGWKFPDADGDGVVDDEDCNPDSNAQRPSSSAGRLRRAEPAVRERLHDGRHDRGPADGSRNHGGFVSAVAALTNAG